MQYQQNLKKYTIGFIVLNVINNNYETVLPLVNEINLVLLNENAAKLVIITGLPSNDE
ncbi:MAG TPA: hypothetical protein VFW07_25780 [Parafilimonas sp.]|nr:hypothetical protein [Parafilimonas sp.]